MTETQEGLLWLAGLQGWRVLVQSSMKFYKGRDRRSSSRWDQAALNLQFQNLGEAQTKEGSKPPAKPWNILALQF